MAKGKSDATPLRLVRKADIGKRIAFDRATFMALDLYARDSMKTFQELADEAFADLLAKHGRPIDLKEALRQSTRTMGANDNPLRKPTKPRRK
jgi:hypothetical protein